MARRTIAPSVGRRQDTLPRHALPSQVVLPDALLMPVEQIVPDPGQPRRHFDEEALAQLAESIAREGLLEPLVVREEGLLSDGRTRYMIIAGGRRYRAALEAGLSVVPVLVRTGLAVTQIRILQLMENLQREDLDPLEEGLALRELMQLAGLSLDAIAEKIGKSKAYVQRRTDLLYDPRLAELVRDGAINASVAVELRHLAENQRGVYLARIAAGERLEVAQLREEKRRARAILFGDVGKRHPVAIGSSPVESGEQSAQPAAEHPYQFDTGAQGGAAPPDKHAEEGSYRFDTSEVNGTRSGTVLSTSPSENVGGTGTVALVSTTAAVWAEQHAQSLVEAGDGIAWQGALHKAVQAWSAAGSPIGWGDALLEALAVRLEGFRPG